MTNENEAPELLPCPFCGGDNLMFHFENIDGWIAHVCCRDCDDMMGPMSAYKYGDQDEAKQDVTVLWNTRADISDAKDKRIEELRLERDKWFGQALDNKHRIARVPQLEREYIALREAADALADACKMSQHQFTRPIAPKGHMDATKEKLSEALAAYREATK